MQMVLQPGDRVKLRKKHPCGSDEWEVYRVGADIRMRCVGCGRSIQLSRSVFRKRLKEVITTPSVGE